MKSIITILLLCAILVLAGCDGKSITEESQEITECQGMSLEEAITIAEESQCIVEGSLLDESMCNENTATWWIELDTEKEGCNPACVVNVLEGTAEINWRCTGLILE